MDSSATQIQLPDPNNPTILRFRSEGTRFLEHAANFTIDDDDQLTEALAYARDIANGKKTIELFFKPIKQGIDGLKKIVLGQESGLLRPYLEADVKLRGRITLYQVERQRRLDAEAAALREAERKRLEEEQINRAAALEQMAVATGDEAYRKEAEAELDAPVQVPTMVVQPRVKGASMRTEVSVQVDDLMKLVCAVAAGKVPLEAVQANESWLRREAVQRGTAFAIPGVRRVETKDITIRR